MGRILAALVTLALLAGASCQSVPASGGGSEEASERVPDRQGTPESSPPGEGGTFRYASAEPSSILPSDVVDTESAVVVDAVFDSLTAYAARGALVPAAAVEWQPDETLTEWRFSLRPGATFHDGTPVTADDFVASWTRTAAQGRAHYHLEDVEGYQALRDGTTTALTGVSAPDPLTFVVRLTAPFADFPAVAAHPALAPLPRQGIEGDPAAYASDPVGNGPFQVESWSRGVFLRVMRFPDWSNGGGPPRVDEVLFQFEDAETAYIGFQQGRRDFAPLPPDALTDAIDRYQVAVEGYRGPGVLNGRTGQLYFLGMNHHEPPFNDPAVRLALNLAIDRRGLASGVREGNADPAFGAVPRAVPGGRVAPCDICAYDPAQARQLFAAAGVSELELWFNRDGGHEQIASLLRRQLAGVGVTLVTRTPEDPEPGISPFTAYLEQLRGGEAKLFRFGWSVEYPTLDDALVPLFASSSGGNGGANYGGYAREDVDALISQARATPSQAERRLLYQQVEDLALNRDQAIVPLLTFRHAAVVSDRFLGFALSELGLPNLAEVRPAPRSSTATTDREPRR